MSRRRRQLAGAASARAPRPQWVQRQEFLPTVAGDVKDGNFLASSNSRSITGPSPRGVKGSIDTEESASWSSSVPSAEQASRSDNTSESGVSCEGWAADQLTRCSSCSITGGCRCETRDHRSGRAPRPTIHSVLQQRRKVCAAASPRGSAESKHEDARVDPPNDRPGDELEGKVEAFTPREAACRRFVQVWEASVDFASLQVVV